MPSRSPNSKVRAAWQQAQSVVKRDEQRELTQQEFLDVSFGNNPRTGKPYNPRTLRKWLKGERNAQQAVRHSESDSWSFQQFVSVDEQDYGVTLTKPANRSGLELWRPTRRADIKRAARSRLSERAEQNIIADRPRVETKVHKDRNTGQTTIETYRPVRNTRGLKLQKARAVRKERAGVIITREARAA